MKFIDVPAFNPEMPDQRVTINPYTVRSALEIPDIYEDGSGVTRIFMGDKLEMHCNIDCTLSEFNMWLAEAKASDLTVVQFERTDRNCQRAGLN